MGESGPALGASRCPLLTSVRRACNRHAAGTTCLHIGQPYLHSNPVLIRTVYKDIRQVAVAVEDAFVGQVPAGGWHLNAWLEFTQFLECGG